MGVLRLIIQRKGECYNNYPSGGHDGHFNNYSYMNGSNAHMNSASYRATNLINQIKNFKDFSTTLTSHNHSSNQKPFVISYPEDFRPVSAIIDVDILPDTYRRVRLHKHKSSKPLGFYIRDGRSLRVTPHGVEQVPGIFISRLMPGGLAESTGLLSVNDEVIEVNGIEVAGKTLDQVTDMMVANSSNLIITVKPTNQRYNLNRSINNTTSSKLSSIKSVTGLNPTQNRSSIKSGKSAGPIKPQAPRKSTESNNNLSSNTPLSSVNSSFSSSNNPNTKNSNGKESLHNNLNHLTDSAQITLEIGTKSNGQSNSSHVIKQIKHLHLDESDNNVDDDEEDEEILHNGAVNSPNRVFSSHNISSGAEQDNSDDKILTL